MSEEKAPQKRKRNRKKKSKGGDNNTVPAKNEVKPEEPDKMNPHAILRNKLQKEGFTSDEIDKAMEEMWDKNLAYDEFEAVLKYLKTGGKDDENDKEDKKSEEKESTKTKPQQTNKEESVEETKEEVEASESVAAKPPPPMTMTARLDMVAGFDNMTDAIFALTEWVNKAAKPNEVSLIVYSVLIGWCFLQRRLIVVY